MTQVDNSTFIEKKTIRLKALDLIDETPIVMETHGGKGEIYNACYWNMDTGIVFEKLPDKADVLAKQRPSWRVYEADCEVALKNGIGADLPITLLDIDPYGEPWHVIDAFFTSERAFASKMVVVVNDGLRQKLRIKSDNVQSMQGMVLKYGNKLAARYLQVCRELMEAKVGQAGYSMTDFRGYYCGNLKAITHYYASLNRGN